MSRIRQGACAEPGPFDLHCDAHPLHRYSCYDAGEDESWNDRFPEDWQTETPHACDDPACEASQTSTSVDAQPEDSRSHTDAHYLSVDE